MHATAFDDHEQALDFEETRPSVAQLMRQGAEFLHTNAAWCIRCATRLIGVRGDLDRGLAHAVSEALARDAEQRAREPEQVAEDFIRLIVLE